MTHAFLDSESLEKGAVWLGGHQEELMCDMCGHFGILRTTFGTNFDARHLMNFMGQFGDIWDNLGHLHRDFYGIVCKFMCLLQSSYD